MKLNPEYHIEELSSVGAAMETLTVKSNVIKKIERPRKFYDKYYVSIIQRGHRQRNSDEYIEKFIKQFVKTE